MLELSSLIFSDSAKSFPKKTHNQLCMNEGVFMYLHLNKKYMHFLFIWRIFCSTLFKMNTSKRLVHKENLLLFMLLMAVNVSSKIEGIH